MTDVSGDYTPALAETGWLARWRSLGACIGASLLLRSGGSATGVLLGLLLARLSRVDPESGINASVVGLLSAGFYAAELAGAPFFGMLADRGWLRKLFLIGPLCGATGAILTVFTASVPVLLLTRLLEGFSSACTIPAALAYLAGATAGDRSLRARALSFFEVSSIAGFAVGYAMGGMAWDRMGRGGFFLSALGYVLAGFLLWTVGSVEPTAREARSKTIWPWQHSREALELAPAWLAVNAVAGVWFSHAAFQLSGATARSGQLLTGGLSGTGIGLVFSLWALVFAGGIVVWGFLLKRIAATTAMLTGVGGLFMAILGVLAMNHGASIGSPQALIGASLLILGVGLEAGFAPAALVYLAERADRAGGRGAVMGLYSTLLAGGQLLGAAVAGPPASAWAVDGLVLVTMVLALVALAPVLVLHRQAGRALGRVGSGQWAVGSGPETPPFP